MPEDSTLKAVVRAGAAGPPGIWYVLPSGSVITDCNIFLAGQASGAMHFTETVLSGIYYLGARSSCL